MEYTKIKPYYYVTSLVVDGLKHASFTRSGDFKDLNDKVAQLLPLCSRNNVIALPANELLAAGGTKHLMWVDIDSRDHDAVERWLMTDCPFPQDSYVMVPSTTLKWHMYVVTDRPIKSIECIAMYDIIRSTVADPELNRRIDRVYGPDVTSHAIYIPGAARGRPSLPQQLCRDLKGVYTLPELEHVSWSKWPERRVKVT